MAAWVLMAFLHRNAPTADFSKLFFRIDIFFLLIGSGFLPLTVLFIWKENKAFYIILFPAFVVAMYALFSAPVDVFWSKFGWSYKFASLFENVFQSIMMIYTLLFCGAFLHLSQRISSKPLARKYILVFVGYLIIMVLGMIITTFFVQRYPDFPPFGGILTFLQFLLIAYAVRFKPDKITMHSKMKTPVSKLANAYIEFLNEFQVLLPGKALAESAFRFQDYLEAMGLEQIVEFKSGKLIFETDSLNGSNLHDTPGNIINALKQFPWAGKISARLAPILIETYAVFYSQSEIKGKTWLKNLFQNHGGFLTIHNLLSYFPEKFHAPEILEKIKPGHVCIFKEEIPLQAYELFKKIKAYSFEGLCISKLSPTMIGRKYGIQNTSFLWITFEKDKEGITPKDVNGLTKNISGFLTKSNGAILVFDCLDQIKFANNFKISLAVLKNIVESAVKHKAVLFVSIPPDMFENRELSSLETEFGEKIVKWN